MPQTGPLLYSSLSLVVCMLPAVLQNLLEVGYVDWYTFGSQLSLNNFLLPAHCLFCHFYIIWLDYPRRIMWHIDVCNNLYLGG
jgi:hypothetical protein